jgi:hypothetical protein
MSILGRAEKWVGGALLAVAGLGTVGVVATRWDLARRKGDLAGAAARESAALGDRPRALVTAMDEVVLAAAEGTWPGDFVAGDLVDPAARSALFEGSIVYARAAVPELSRLDAIGAAVRRSEKDAFVLCLVEPPREATAAALRAAATRYWMGGALFEDATHDVFSLSQVHKGLRPLSDAFAAELAEADDHLFVRRLEEEYDQRTPNALSMARTAASADLLVVVADELPAGFAPPEVGKSLTATRRPAVLPQIEGAPHVVRVVVWSAERRGVVLRIRVPVDARGLGLSEAERIMIAPHVQGCQAAVALRGGPPP